MFALHDQLSGVFTDLEQMGCMWLLSFSSRNLKVQGCLMHRRPQSTLPGGCGMHYPLVTSAIILFSQKSLGLFWVLAAPKFSKSFTVHLDVCWLGLSRESIFISEKFFAHQHPMEELYNKWDSPAVIPAICYLNKTTTVPVDEFPVFKDTIDKGLEALSKLSLPDRSSCSRVVREELSLKSTIDCLKSNPFFFFVFF